MSLFDSLRNAASWSLLIGARFVRYVPGSTIIVVLATLISQIAMLLAFFLPIKVVILLGSTGIPGYFPSVLAEIDRNTLIIALSISAIGAYLLYLLSERVIVWSSDFGARHLLARGSKLVLFENQGEMAVRGYRRYAHALASGIFVLLGCSALVLLYPAVAFLTAIYFLSTTALLLLICTIKEGALVGFRQKLRPVLSTAGMVGFLISFAYMVADFLWWSPPSLIIALISILLLRQIFGRLAFMIGDISALYQQRIELSALFFKRHVLLTDYAREERGMWPLLVPKVREIWVKSVLDEVVGADSEPLSVQWHQHTFGSIAALEIKTDIQQKGGYLIRLFDENRGMFALHEATLLASMTGLIFPAPRFLGATRVENCHCHVFDCEDFSRVLRSEVAAFSRQVVQRLIEIEPPDELVQRYTGSRPCLWQRLDGNVFQRLRVAVENESQLRDLSTMDQAWPYLQTMLKDLPLVIINPDLNVETLFLSAADEGAPAASWWGRWSLDPVGSAWPVQAKSLAALGDALGCAARQRKSLQSVSLSDVKIAALLYALEQHFLAQQYKQALCLLPQILELIDVDGLQMASEVIPL